MSDDNNQKSRGPRKGGGAGGRGGGKDGGSRGGGFGSAGRGPSRSAAPGGGERKPFRSRPEGAERPSRSAGESSERPQRRYDKPAGAPRPPREGGERPFRARPDGERSASRPPRDGGKRFERSPRQRSEEAVATPTVLASLLPQEPERIAKVMARAGVASRRDSEAMIAEGRVSVNGKVLESPALDIGPGDVVLVDGEPLPARERTRMWLYHKPRGLVTTNHDPEGRPTVFDSLPEDLPRVLSIGRLDINTEGLLLLTNDGGLARMLELPETGWLRRYRVRAFGQVTQDRLDTLRDGVTIEGIAYGPVVARFERQQGSNTWLTVDLREGKNREVKTVLEHLGLDVNRLIRVSFGPFQLADLPEGGVDEIRSRVLKDQLGEELMAKAGVDFEAPRRDEMPVGAAKVASGETRRAPSGDDRPRRRDAGGERDRPGSDVVRTPSQDDRSEKPWKRTTWRAAEAEPQRERKAPPRRGADPRLERQTREASGEVVRKRDKAIEDPRGRRVLVERVSPSGAERPQQDAAPTKRRPDRLPRSERGRAEAAPARMREDRAGGATERPARRPRPDAGERDRGNERPWYEGSAAGERPQRPPRTERPERAPREGDERAPRRFTERPGEDRPRGRSFGDKPGGTGPKSYAARSSERPAGRSAGAGRSFGGKPSGGGKPFGGKPFGGKPGGSRPGGGRPGGGKPGGGRPRSGGKRD